MTASRIKTVRARQVLDSRGRPTVEAEIVLADESVGAAIVPSGASTGRHEAHELRDGDLDDHGGKSVRRAVRHVNEDIAAVLIGRDGLDQVGVDGALRALDGSPNLARIGANAVLAASLAVARAAAAHRRVALHEHISDLASSRPVMPMPMVNILSGGAHAYRGMDFQDFLVVPVGAENFSDALDMACRVRAAAGEIMAQRGLPILLADEGGLSPGFPRARDALDLMMAAFDRAKLHAGDKAAIAIDVAATELFANGRYDLAAESLRLTGQEMADHVAQLVRDYPIISVEDPLAEDDWDHWTAFARMAPCQIIGDDLFATNESRIELGVARRAANAVLIKPNQNGTLTGTLSALALARRSGFAAIVSARSGETEDHLIADLAVGAGAGQIKVGSVRSSERLSKYNQLLRIEERRQFELARPFAAAPDAKSDKVVKNH